MAVPQIQEAQMRHRSIQRLKKKNPTGDLSAAANSQGEEKTNITCHYVLEVLSEGAQLTCRGTRKSHLVSLCNPGWLQPDLPFC